MTQRTKFPKEYRAFRYTIDGVLLYRVLTTKVTKKNPFGWVMQTYTGKSLEDVERQLKNQGFKWVEAKEQRLAKM